MSSIRNLSGAPTIDVGGHGAGNRRRSRSGDHGGGDIASSLTYSPFASFVSSTETTHSRPNRMSRSMLGGSLHFGSGGSHQHNAPGGEVMASMPSSAASMRWKPSYNVRDDYRLSDASDNIGSSRNLSPHPLHASLTKPPSPTSGGKVLRKLRGSTWDAAASMTKLSPKISLPKSSSMDGDSPVGSSLPPALPFGQNKGDPQASKFRFEEGEEDLFDSDSDRSEEIDHDEYEDAKICEEKEEELLEEGEDIMVTAKKLSSLEPFSEVENEDSPKNETSRSPGFERGIGRTKSILKNGSTFGNSNHSSDSGTSKGVQFKEVVLEVVGQDSKERSEEDGEEEDERDEEEKVRRESRPSFCAKLPALQKWDDFDEEDAGSTITSTSPVARKNSMAAFTHFERKNSQPPPSLLSRLNCSWSLIGSCIVRTAPCFWCSKKLSMSATDREILLRLNRLCAFFSLLQICYGIFTLVMKFMSYSENDQPYSTDKEGADKPWFNPDLWSLDMFVISLSVINFVLLIASMVAQRAIRDVNLVGAVRFMWVLFWLLPLQIFFTIGLFDVYRVHEVRTKHWWDDPSMTMSREIFCDEGTANDQCKVPIGGGEGYDTEEQWCQERYNATNCRHIRDDAQFEYNVAIRIANIANGIWGLVLVVIMWVTLCVLQAVITLPIVQRSKESNIPLWLTFPIIGCLFVGISLQYSQASVADELKDINLIALAYIVSGALFAQAAMIGIFLKCYTVLNSRQRRIKQGIVVLFIVTIFLTLFSVGTIFVTSLIYSLGILNPVLEKNDYQEVACALDLSGSCTGCDQDDVNLKCPEWTEDDVNSALDTTMKQSATLAAIFLVYALITLRYGFVLLHYVNRYQIEYV